MILGKKWLHNKDVAITCKSCMFEFQFVGCKHCLIRDKDLQNVPIVLTVQVKRITRKKGTSCFVIVVVD